MLELALETEPVLEHALEPVLGLELGRSFARARRGRERGCTERTGLACWRWDERTPGGATHLFDTRSATQRLQSQRYAPFCVCVALFLEWGSFYVYGGANVGDKKTLVLV